MKRRTLIKSLILLPAGMLASRLAMAMSKSDIKDMQNNWRDLLPADFSPPDPSPKLEQSASQWREQLSQPQFDILRQEGTERPFTSPLNDEKREGVFTCAGCDLPLFTSGMKYDSGTGWPSFFTSIPEAMGTKRDFKLVWPRTEYHCIRCGGHQGHIFKDGPAPTRERWCNNGLALRFRPKQAS